MYFVLFTYDCIFQTFKDELDEVLPTSAERNKNDTIGPFPLVY